MFLSNTVPVKWNGKNKQYYISKGYLFTKIADTFQCRIQDLSKGSRTIVTLKCDNCGKEFQKPYGNLRDKAKHYCKECRITMMKRTIKEKYNVSCVSKLKSVQDKIKKTNLERYGCEHPMQNKDVLRKQQMTNKKRYGHITPLLNTQVNPHIYQKFSYMQKHICELVYGTLNYYEHGFYIDVALVKEHIAIEYDGGGHDLSIKLHACTPEQFQKKEIQRTEILQRIGWKLIRIINKKDLQIENALLRLFINYSKMYLNKGHHWIHVDFDKHEVRTSQFTKSFGELE